MLACAAYPVLRLPSPQSLATAEGEAELLSMTFLAPPAGWAFSGTPGNSVGSGFACYQKAAP